MNVRIKREIMDFIRDNVMISILSGVAILIIISYIVSIDLPELWDNAGIQFEILYQISLAIIASFIFYIMQIYIPQRKKKKAIRPYITRLMNKISDSMDIIIRELSKCYLNQDISIVNITDEELKCIINNYSPRHKTTIQVAFEIRNLTNYEMMECQFQEIDEYINKLISGYIGFMDDESEILIRDIANCQMKNTFSSKGNMLMALCGTKGISGDAPIHIFKNFKHLHFQLREYIHKSEIQ